MVSNDLPFVEDGQMIPQIWVGSKGRIVLSWSTREAVDQSYCHRLLQFQTIIVTVTIMYY